MRLWLLLVPVLAMAQEVPAGTEISIRLTSVVSTRTSHAGDSVDAVVIAPVVANGRAMIRAGAVVHGTLEKIATPSKPEERATLLLTFAAIDQLTMVARVAGVDNAREKVDDQGQIHGILASETMTGRLDDEIGKLGDQASGFASILNAAKKAVFQEASTDIEYGKGVEMTLKLTRPLMVPPVRVPPPPGWQAADRSTLLRLISRDSFQTTAERPARPSDVTNLLIVATEEELRGAFTAAGWTGAAKLNSLSRFETLRALAEDRGYNEAPVSLLLLDGKPPDMVFEKTNNTFARRHHLRIWRRPYRLGGKDAWAVAATHDVGIDFSEAERTFIHRIDSQIDREREKVVNDLLFTRQVTAFDLLDRPDVPRKTRNATGDSIETDGRIAVLLLDR